MARYRVTSDFDGPELSQEQLDEIVKSQKTHGLTVIELLSDDQHPFDRAQINVTIHKHTSGIDGQSCRFCYANLADDGLN